MVFLHRGGGVGGGGGGGRQQVTDLQNMLYKITKSFLFCLRIKKVRPK